jgi:hypothetical protein
MHERYPDDGRLASRAVGGMLGATSIFFRICEAGERALTSVVACTVVFDRRPSGHTIRTPRALHPWLSYAPRSLKPCAQVAA